MKEQKIPHGELYSAMLRGRTKLTVITGVIIILFAMYTSSILPYIEKKVFGATDLDADEFAKSTSVIVLDKDYQPENEDEAKIFGFARKTTSYWDNGKYYFSAVAENAEK